MRRLAFEVTRGCNEFFRSRNTPFMEPYALGRFKRDVVNPDANGGPSCEEMTTPTPAAIESVAPTNTLPGGKQTFQTKLFQSESPHNQQLIKP